MPAVLFPSAMSAQDVCLCAAAPHRTKKQQFQVAARLLDPDLEMVYLLHSAIASDCMQCCRYYIELKNVSVLRGTKNHSAWHAVAQAEYYKTSASLQLYLRCRSDLEEEARYPQQKAASSSPCSSSSSASEELRGVWTMLPPDNKLTAQDQAAAEQVSSTSTEQASSSSTDMACSRASLPFSVWPVTGNFVAWHRFSL